MPDITGAFTPEQLRRVCNVLVIVANAEIHTETDWSVSGHKPGLVETLQSRSTPSREYSTPRR